MNDLSDGPPNVSFLLYESRSGSTMLASLLDRFSGINVIPENNMVSRILLFPEPITSIKIAKKVFDCIYAEPQFQELGVPRSALMNALLSVDGEIAKPDLAALCIREVLRSMGLSPSKHTLIKSACYESMDVISQHWPSTRYLHIVRDGRAVFNSLRKNRSLFRREVMNSNVVAAASSWQRKVFLTTGRSDTLTLRYEDILKNQQPCIASVLDFLEVPIEGRQAIETCEGYAQRIGASQRDLHINVGTDVKPDRSNAWEHEIEPSVRYAYQELARQGLQQWGYAMEPNFCWIDRFTGRIIIARDSARLPFRYARILLSSMRRPGDLRLRIKRRLQR